VVPRPGVNPSEVFRYYGGDAVKVTWEKGALKIDVPCGKIVTFKNFAYVPGEPGGPVQFIPVRLDAYGPLECG
jgi:hypothetical protein